MKEYIDVESVSDFFESTVQGICENEPDNLMLNSIWDLFFDLPTVTKDNIIKHGYWEMKRYSTGAFDYCFVCSECHKETPDGAFVISPDYCPSCGAKMDKVAGDIE